MHYARYLAGSALVLSLGLGLAGCSAPPEEMGEPPPPAVTVDYPLVREVLDYAQFTGRVTPVDSVKVRARVWGYLQKVNFVEGAEVQKNDVLFEIDPQTYQTAVDQAKARLALAEAQLTQMASEATRQTYLRGKDAVAQEELERALTARATATATVAAARADLKRAELDLAFTKVRAPVAGRVGRTQVTVGNLVQSGETGGTVLTTLVSLEPMWAYFDVDELTFQQVSPLVRAVRAQKTQDAPDDELPLVQLGLAGETGFPHQGHIDFVDNQVDPNTGTARMRGVFPNGDQALTPGLFARIHLPLGRAHRAVLITDRAIDTDQGQKVAYIVNAANVVERREVVLGGLHEGLREIKSGVEPGERVVVDGIQRVRGGIPVVPNRAETPPAQTAKLGN
jgi:RND family efflux transporter MFP subunit